MFILIADDTIAFYSHKDIKVINETLNNELRKRGSAWLQANKLTLHVKKTQVILFKTRNKMTMEPLKIQISNTEIEQVNSTKFLGINIDLNLTREQCITYIIRGVQKLVEYFPKQDIIFQ